VGRRVCPGRLEVSRGSAATEWMVLAYLYVSQLIAEKTSRIPSFVWMLLTGACAKWITGFLHYGQPGGTARGRNRPREGQQTRAPAGAAPPAEAQAGQTVPGGGAKEEAKVDRTGAPGAKDSVRRRKAA